MSEQQTEAPDIAGLVERIRSKGAGPMTKILLMHEAAEALEALQAERDELKTTIAERTMHWEETSRELVDLRATIASLREALEEIAYTTPDGTEDSDLEIYKTLASKRARIARQALAREPDIGTTPKEEWQPPANVKPWMVCAACRAADGFIVASARHWDEVMREQINAHERKTWGRQWEQGFIDQWGRFYTRQEAMLAVIASGQPFNAERQGGITHELYSEGLY